MTQSPVLSLEQAIAMTASSGVVLVDVREPAEIAATGAAKGALRIPLGLLRLHVDPNSPDFQPAFKSGKPVCIYCAAGGRAGQAKQLMESLGHDDVHNIGGFTHWASAGGATER